MAGEESLASDPQSKRKAVFTELGCQSCLEERRKKALGAGKRDYLKHFNLGEVVQELVLKHVRLGMLLDLCQVLCCMEFNMFV